MKEDELIDEEPEEELDQGTLVPSNLVEIETPSETWKTEFKNEISSLRINGEDVSKIHRAMEELRKMRDSSDRKLRRFIMLITLLLCSGLGIGVYSLNYLLRFNADKIDEVIDLNLIAIKKTKQGMIKIPLIAVSLLEKHRNQMRWDANRSTWTFLDTFTASRMDFSSDFMFYNPQSIEQLKKDYGLFWNGSSWNWPEGYGPKN